MPEYINPNPYMVQLVGPDGKTVSIRSKKRKILDSHFDRYVSKGYLQRTDQQPAIKQPAAKQIQTKVRLNNNKPRRQIIAHKIARQDQQQQQQQQRQKTADRHKQRLVRKAQAISKRRTAETKDRRQVVGKRIHIDGQELLRRNLTQKTYPISNNIGVGILSYNRHRCLRRLIDSIMRHTDLSRTTVFISDDGSTDQDTVAYIRELAANKNFVVLHNSENIGVAGNSNRLVRCLSRFQYGLLLNDDVEVLQDGWDEFYVKAMQQTGMHHFQHRQPGVYGATTGTAIERHGVQLHMVEDKPHGAVMAFSRDMLVKCGYFNEDYGQYGMEHVDWSSKAFEFGLQPAGFYDVQGSQRYFHLHAESSAVEERTAKLRAAREVHGRRFPERIGPTNRSRVPEITYVIPFRDIGRQDSFATVANNVRAQRFPVIHIIMVEQDKGHVTNTQAYQPVHYYLAKETQHLLFNKSMAFNMGVANAMSDKVILHDADMVVTGDYTTAIWDTLKVYEACHMGGTVVYATNEATQDINGNKRVTVNTKLERVVGYFEGGSLACTTNAYWRIGGFNEDFYGYGCEDCEFYARLSRNTNWREDRRFDFLHLWHSRVPNWNDHHEANRLLEQALSRTNMTVRVDKQRQQLCKIGYNSQVENSK